MQKSDPTPRKTIPWGIIAGICLMLVGIILIALGIHARYNRPDIPKNFSDWMLGISMVLIAFGFILIIANIPHISTKATPSPQAKISPAPVKTPDQTPFTGNIKIRCTNCKTLNEEDAKFCKNCAKEL